MTTSRREAMIGLLERLPTAAVSRLVGRLCRLPLPGPVRGPLWRRVAERVGMSLAEAAEPVEAFASFDALFTRRLLPDARPVEWVAGALVAPADGRLTGVPDGAGPVIVKGGSGELAEWLGRADLPWREPCAAVTYLSPRDYHRVHAPVRGRIVGVTYTPGVLVPVNPAIIGDSGRALGRNERVTCWLDSEMGMVAVAMVGALCVGGIELMCPSLSANRSVFRRRIDRDLGAASVPVEAGDELGAFHMGSSVVLAWEGRGFEASPSLTRGRAIRVGQRLGAWTSEGSERR